MAAFPVIPLTATVTPRIVTWNADLTPALGGPVTRVRRLGSRFAADVSIPALDAADGVCWGDWLGARARSEAQGETLTLTLPQMVSGAPAASVSAGGATGYQIPVTATGVQIAAGTLFSFLSGGRNYLHMVTNTANAGATGLYIAPQLRASPPTGALNFAGPVLEGFLTDGKIEWTLDRLRFFGLAFTIQENR